MRRLSIIFVALAMLALAVPASGASAHDRNVDFLRALIGADELGEPATLADGSVVTLADAIDLAAARAGDIDLGAMMAGSNTGGPGKYVGDIWVVEMAPGACPEALIGPQSPASTDAAPQTEIHRGGAGAMSSDGGYYTTVFAWTMKVTEIRGLTPWDAAGSIEPFCFTYFGLHFNMPFIDGVFAWGAM